MVPPLWQASHLKHANVRVIIGPDGLSRLRLAKAITGVRQGCRLHPEGISGPEEIAAFIVEHYDPRWIEREVAKRRFESRYVAEIARVIREQLAEDLRLAA
jgi:hypothetical protein